MYYAQRGRPSSKMRSSTRESLIWRLPREVRDNIYRVVLSTEHTGEKTDALRPFGADRVIEVVQSLEECNLLRQFSRLKTALTTFPPPSYKDIKLPARPIARVLDTRIMLTCKRLRLEMLEYIYDYVFVCIALGPHRQLSGGVMDIIAHARHLRITYRDHSTLYTEGSRSTDLSAEHKSLRQLAGALSRRRDMISFEFLILGCGHGNAGATRKRTGMPPQTDARFSTWFQLTVLRTLEMLPSISTTKTLRVKWVSEKDLPHAGPDLSRRYQDLVKNLQQGEGKGTGIGDGQH